MTTAMAVIRGQPAFLGEFPGRQTVVLDADGANDRKRGSWRALQKLLERADSGPVRSGRTVSKLTGGLGPPRGNAATQVCCQSALAVIKGL
jgi:hypothetical protein